MAEWRMVIVLVIGTIGVMPKPIVDPGLFVIQGVTSCINGTGYCMLGNNCSVDIEFLSDDKGGHCDGLRDAFTPKIDFVCCRYNGLAKATSEPPTTTISSYTITDVFSLIDDEIIQQQQQEEELPEDVNPENLIDIVGVVTDFTGIIGLVTKPWTGTIPTRATMATTTPMTPDQPPTTPTPVPSPATPANPDQILAATPSTEEPHTEEPSEPTESYNEILAETGEPMMPDQQKESDSTQDSTSLSSQDSTSGTDHITLVIENLDLSQESASFSQDSSTPLPVQKEMTESPDSGTESSEMPNSESPQESSLDPYDISSPVGTVTTSSSSSHESSEISSQASDVTTSSHDFTEASSLAGDVTSSHDSIETSSQANDVTTSSSHDSTETSSLAGAATASLHETTETSLQTGDVTTTSSHDITETSIVAGASITSSSLAFSETTQTSSLSSSETSSPVNIPTSTSSQTLSTSPPATTTITFSSTSPQDSQVTSDVTEAEEDVFIPSSVVTQETEEMNAIIFPDDPIITGINPSTDTEALGDDKETLISISSSHGSPSAEHATVEIHLQEEAGNPEPEPTEQEAGESMMPEEQNGFGVNDYDDYYANYPDQFLLEPVNQNICGFKGFGYGVEDPGNSRILGGEVTSAVEWCWVAAIMERRRSGDKFVCSGALIESDLVLTTATCLKRLESRDLSRYIVVLGDSNLQDSLPYGVQFHSIVEVATHPDYFTSGGAHANDIGVVRLRNHATFSDNVCLVCMAQQDAVFPARSCTVTGYGIGDIPRSMIRDVRNEVPSEGLLRKLSVPILKEAMCQEALRNMTGSPILSSSESFLCAGGFDADSACYSTLDGGSPLACEAGGRWFVAGLVSWTRDCTLPGIPNIYTRVASFTNWLQATHLRMMGFVTHQIRLV